MPTVSQYVFRRNNASDAGPFFHTHVSHGTSPSSWAWATIFNLPDSHATLVWERPDSEMVLDLGAMANNSIALAAIDGVLTSPVSRSGAVRVTYIPWSRVPDGVKGGSPGRHESWELLVRVTIPFHASLPWYCPDADGTIGYYIFFSLSGGGDLTAVVEGWEWHRDWAGICGGELSNGLNAAVPGGVAILQDLLNTALPVFTSGRTFNMLYLLPGDGTRSGFSEQNADNNVALAVIPN